MVYFQRRHERRYSLNGRKANQCDERVFIFEIPMQCLPIRIIPGKGRERGYISNNHLNQTG